MDNKVKKEIDELWMNTLFGKWCKSIAKEEFEKAKEIETDIFEQGYLMMELLEEEVAEKIYKHIKTSHDFTDYLKQLDGENPELVDVLLRTKFYEKLSDYEDNI